MSHVWFPCKSYFQNVIGTSNTSTLISEVAAINVNNRRSPFIFADNLTFIIAGDGSGHDDTDEFNVTTDWDVIRAQLSPRAYRSSVIH